MFQTTFVVLLGCLVLYAADSVLRPEGLEDRLGECERQCRYASASPLKRRVTGLKVDGQCHCTGTGSVATVPFFTPGNCPADEWCGSFDTTVVCAVADAAGRGPLLTTTRAAAAAAQQTVLHCGACGACSAMRDLLVLNTTRTTAVERLTKCATAYAKPAWLGGHASTERLRQCLVSEGLGFSTDGAAWNDPTDMPSCMDCWTDDIGCASSQCVTNVDCVKKLSDPSNKGARDGCVQCDEERCGVAFLQCAGANRRAAGIISDIHRPKREVCSIGYFGSDHQKYGAPTRMASRNSGAVVFGASLNGAG